MSGMSNVGGRGVYEAGDQRNVKDSEVNEAERYKEGQPNSHLANDSSTQLNDICCTFCPPLVPLTLQFQRTRELLRTN